MSEETPEEEQPPQKEIDLAEIVRRLEAIEQRVMTDQGLNDLAHVLELRLVSRMKYGRNPRIEQTKKKD